MRRLAQLLASDSSDADNAVLVDLARVHALVLPGALEALTRVGTAFSRAFSRVFK